MGGIPQFIISSLYEGPVSNSGNQGDYPSSQESLSEILGSIDKQGARYIGPDGSIKYLRESDSKEKPGKDYSPESLNAEIEELEEIVTGFNSLFTETNFYKGFLLERSGKDNHKVQLIPLMMLVNAKIAVGQIREVLSGYPVAQDECGYLPPMCPVQGLPDSSGQLMAKRKIINGIYNGAFPPIYEAISNSYRSVFARAEEELDSLRAEFNEYESGMNDWLEGLALMDNMNDDKMDELINENVAICNTLRSSLDSILNGKGISRERMADFNGELDTFLMRLLHNRYELNKILATSQSAGRHILWNTVEILGGIATSALGPAAGVAGSGGFSYVTTRNRQGSMYDAYDELNLDYGESPFQDSEAYLNAGISSVFASAGPIIGKIPVVKKGVNKIVVRPARKLLKSFKGLFHGKTAATVPTEAVENAAEQTVKKTGQQTNSRTLRGLADRLNGLFSKQTARKAYLEAIEGSVDSASEKIANRILDDVYKGAAEKVSENASRKLSGIVADRVLEKLGGKASDESIRGYVNMIARRSVGLYMDEAVNMAVVAADKAAADSVRMAVRERIIRGLDVAAWDEIRKTAFKASGKAAYETAVGASKEMAGKTAGEALMRTVEESLKNAAEDTATKMANDLITEAVVDGAAKEAERYLIGKGIEKEMTAAAEKALSEAVVKIAEDVESEAVETAVKETIEMTQGITFLKSFSKGESRFVNYLVDHPYIHSVLEPELAKMSYSLLSAGGAKSTAIYTGKKLMTKPSKFITNDLKGEFKHDFDPEKMNLQTTE